jgi:hypothetical protein
MGYPVAVVLNLLCDPDLIHLNQRLEQIKKIVQPPVFYISSDFCTQLFGEKNGTRCSYCTGPRLCVFDQIALKPSP